MSKTTRIATSVLTDETAAMLTLTLLVGATTSSIGAYLDLDGSQILRMAAAYVILGAMFVNQVIDFE